LGFKGTEDIGGGLKANFALETAVTADTGAQGNSARFFDRAAWVGLAGGAGEIRLGRTDSSIGALAGDSSILGGQAYDDLKIVGTRAADKYRRVDNAITYILPTVVQGVTAQLQYSTAGVGYAAGGTIDTAVAGTEPATGSAGRAYGLSVKYTQGPVLAGLGYLNAKDENSVTAGDQRANAVLVYGGYDLGMAKVIGYYDAETSTAAKRMTVVGVKAIVPVTADLTVQAGVSQAKNVAGSALSSDDAVITAVKAVYKLSKRTSVYGIGTLVNNESGSNKGIDSKLTTSNGATTGGIAAGVAHAF
jgi:predicted porin